MGKIYDNWGRLVESVLRRDQLREIAMCNSSITSGGSSRFSFSSTSQFPDQCLADGFDSETVLHFDPESEPWYGALPKFSDACNSEKPQLFIMKANMCCVVFDFVDPVKNLEEKGIKGQTLLELVDYVTSANVKFTEAVMQAVVKMVSVNIFREFTQETFAMEPAWPHWQRKKNLAVNIDLEEDEPVASDPAWPHLQIVYQLLLKFVTSPKTVAKVAKTYISRSFITKLLNLFNLKDPREREFMKIILHGIYVKFLVHRPFIRKAINDVLYHFVYETEEHNGVGEFLEILGSVINGFTWPLREEHMIFLERMLIPLHKPKSLVTYHAQLSYCIVQLVKKDSNLACFVINGLIRYWPVTNSLKEYLFLCELEDVLEVTQEREFKQCIVPLFNQVSRCLNSSHSWVAEKAALFCWDNEFTVNLIKQNCEAIVPILFPALERSARYHWNRQLCNLALVVRDFFYDFNPDLLKECQIKFQDNVSKEHEIKVRREATWKRLQDFSAGKPNETCQGECSSSLKKKKKKGSAALSHSRMRQYIHVIQTYSPNYNKLI